MRALLTVLLTLTAAGASLHAESLWTGADLGPVAIPGGETFGPDGITLTAAGTDIWNRSDQGRLVAQTLVGDGEIFAQVPELDHAHAWSKAGVMIRAGLAADSAHAFVARTGTRGVAFQRRRAAGEVSHHTSGGGSSGPVWLRLRRTGDVFEAFRSADGLSWEAIGSDTIAMPAEVLVGVALTSHDAAVSASARFSGIGVSSQATQAVRITHPASSAVLPLGQPIALAAETDLPGEPSIRYLINEQVVATGSPALAQWSGASEGRHVLVAEATDAAGAPHRSDPVVVEVSDLPLPWVSRPVGSVAAGGGASHDGNAFHLHNAGRDIWGRRDEFRYVFQEVTGDCQIVTRVAHLSAPHAWTKAGLMLRADTGDGAVHALLALTGSNGVAFQHRAVDGGQSAHRSGGSAQAPVWLKLERRGGEITALRSSNGWAWTEVGRVTLELDASILVGLALTSHDRAAPATGCFTDTLVTPLPPVETLAWRLPGLGAAYGLDDPIPLAVEVLDATVDGPVTFHADGMPIATGAPDAAAWLGAEPGVYSLTASAPTADGGSVLSEPRLVLVGELPSPWISEGIGAVGSDGAGTIDLAGEASLRNAGRDIWNRDDAFRYVYRAIEEGDVRIQARVDHLAHVHAWTKVGLMLRAGSAPGAAHSFVCVTGTRGLAFQYRAAAGGTSSHVAGGAGDEPVWLRLERRGTEVIGFASPDGETWNEIGRREMPLEGPALLGLALTSHDAAVSAEAALSEVTVEDISATPLPRLTFDPSDYVLGEADGGIDLTLRLDAPASEPVQVIVARTGGSADPDETAPASATVVIPAGAQTAGFAISVVDDDLAEGDETAIWTIAGAHGARLGEQRHATVTILDDDESTGGNLPPVASVAPVDPVYVGHTITLDGSASHDPDGAPAGLAHQWVQLEGPAVAIDAATSASASVTPSQAGDYVFRLTVTDGADSDSAQLSVTVVAEPIVTFAQASLSVSESVGRYALPLSVSGTILPGTTITLPVSASGLSAEVPDDAAIAAGDAVLALTADPATHVAYVTIVDDDLHEGDEQLQVNLGQPDLGQVGTPGSLLLTIIDDDPANQPPVASIAPLGTVTAGDTVVLDGSGSSDPDDGPQPLVYAWVQTAGETLALSDPSSATPSITPTAAGSYAFTLTVDDGADQASATIAVEVEAPAPSGPAVAFADASLTVLEGDSGSQALTIAVELAAADPVHDRSVVLEQVGGDAELGDDAQLAATTLTFPAGETRAETTLSVFGDEDIERNEILILGFADIGSLSAGSPAFLRIEILSDDPPLPEVQAYDYQSDQARLYLEPPYDANVVGLAAVPQNGALTASAEVAGSLAVVTLDGPLGDQEMIELAWITGQLDGSPGATGAAASVVLDFPLDPGSGQRVGSGGDAEGLPPAAPSISINVTGGLSGVERYTPTSGEDEGIELLISDGAAPLQVEITASTTFGSLSQVTLATDAGHLVSAALGGSNATTTLSLPDLGEGRYRLSASATAEHGGFSATTASEGLIVLVDRSPPELRWELRDSSGSEFTVPTPPRPKDDAVPVVYLNGNQPSENAVLRAKGWPVWSWDSAELRAVVLDATGVDPAITISPLAQARTGIQEHTWDLTGSLAVDEESGLQHYALANDASGLQALPESVTWSEDEPVRITVIYRAYDLELELTDRAGNQATLRPPFGLYTDTRPPAVQPHVTVQRGQRFVTADHDARQLFMGTGGAAAAKLSATAGSSVLGMWALPEPVTVADVDAPTPVEILAIDAAGNGAVVSVGMARRRAEPAVDIPERLVVPNLDGNGWPIQEEPDAMYIVADYPFTIPHFDGFEDGSDDFFMTYGEGYYWTPETDWDFGDGTRAIAPPVIPDVTHGPPDLGFWLEVVLIEEHRGIFDEFGILQSSEPTGYTEEAIFEGAANIERDLVPYYTTEDDITTSGEHLFFDFRIVAVGPDAWEYWLDPYSLQPQVPADETLVPDFEPVYPDAPGRETHIAPRVISIPSSWKASDPNDEGPHYQELRIEGFEAYSTGTLAGLPILKDVEGDTATPKIELDRETMLPRAGQSQVQARGRDGYSWGDLIADGYRWANLVGIENDILAAGSVVTLRIHGGFVDHTPGSTLASVEEFDPDGDYVRFIDSASDSDVTVPVGASVDDASDQIQIIEQRLVAEGPDAQLRQVLELDVALGSEVAAEVYHVDVGLGAVKGYGDALSLEFLGTNGSHRLEKALAVWAFGYQTPEAERASTIGMSMSVPKIQLATSTLDVSVEESGIEVRLQGSVTDPVADLVADSVLQTIQVYGDGGHLATLPLTPVAQGTSPFKPHAKHFTFDQTITISPASGEHVLELVTDISEMGSTGRLWTGFEIETSYPLGSGGFLRSAELRFAGVPDASVVDVVEVLLPSQYPVGEATVVSVTETDPESLVFASEDGSLVLVVDELAAGMDDAAVDGFSCSLSDEAGVIVDDIFTETSAASKVFVTEVLRYPEIDDSETLTYTAIIPADFDPAVTDTMTLALPASFVGPDAEILVLEETDIGSLEFTGLVGGQPLRVVVVSGEPGDPSLTLDLKWPHSSIANGFSASFAQDVEEPSRYVYQIIAGNGGTVEYQVTDHFTAEDNGVTPVWSPYRMQLEVPSALGLEFVTKRTWYHNGSEVAFVQDGDDFFVGDESPRVFVHPHRMPPIASPMRKTIFVEDDDVPANNPVPPAQAQAKTPGGYAAYRGTMGNDYDVVCWVEISNFKDVNGKQQPAPGRINATLEVAQRPEGVLNRVGPVEVTIRLPTIGREAFALVMPARLGRLWSTTGTATTGAGLDVQLFDRGGKLFDAPDGEFEGSLELIPFLEVASLVATTDCRWPSDHADWAWVESDWADDFGDVIPEADVLPESGWVWSLNETGISSQTQPPLWTLPTGGAPATDQFNLRESIKKVLDVDDGEIEGENADIRKKAAFDTIVYYAMRGQLARWDKETAKWIFDGLVNDHLEIYGKRTEGPERQRPNAEGEITGNIIHEQLAYPGFLNLELLVQEMRLEAVEAREQARFEQMKRFWGEAGFSFDFTEQRLIDGINSSVSFAVQLADPFMWVGMVGGGEGIVLPPRPATWAGMAGNVGGLLALAVVDRVTFNIGGKVLKHGGRVVKRSFGSRLSVIRGGPVPNAAAKRRMAREEAYWRNSYCFVAGTRVVTQEGLVPIEEVEPGQMVWARSEDGDRSDWKKVRHVTISNPEALATLRYVYRAGNQRGGGSGSDDDEGDAEPHIIRGTPGHIIWSPSRRAWLAIEELRPGDILATKQGDFEAVVDSVAIEGSAGSPFTTYNLAVEEYPTYFVLPSSGADAGGAVWVHNAGRRLCSEKGLRRAQLRYEKLVSENKNPWKDPRLKNIPDDQKYTIAHGGNPMMRPSKSRQQRPGQQRPGQAVISDKIRYKIEPEGFDTSRAVWDGPCRVTFLQDPLKGVTVVYKRNGMPDFTPFANEVKAKFGIKTRVNITLSKAGRGKDNDAADAAAGITEKFRQDHNLTWHHNEQLGLMELVPFDVNDKFPHTGGRAIFEWLVEVGLL